MDFEVNVDKLKIDKDKCLGCGMCVGIRNSKPVAYPIENKDEALNAVNSCPVSAIVKEEK